MTFSLLALSGSLRAASSNTGLVRMAERIASTDSQLGLKIVTDGEIGSLPFYDADLEDPDRTPAAVRHWRTRVNECDGLFIAAPEYNFGPTAVLKNAIDWASRPPGQHVLRGKVVTLVSSSASTGGKHMTEQLTRVLSLLGNTVIDSPEALFVKGADRISSDGTTTDATVEDIVRARLGAVAEALRSA